MGYSTRMMRKKVPRKETRGAVGVSPARWLSFQVLQGLDKGGAFVEDRLREAWSHQPLSPEDRRLSHQIVYGVLRNRARLDFWIDRMSSKGIASLPPAVVEILRMGLYQIAFLDRTPAHAVVNEAVRHCESLSMGSIKGLVNAILRRFPERRTELDQEVDAHPRRLEIETSHPDWLVRWAKDRFGEERARKWLLSNNQPPKVHLTPLVAKTEEAHSAVASLAAEIGGGRVAADGCSVILPSGLGLADLPALVEGRAYIQDPAAREAVSLLAPSPGETVFDLCSAPGGKSLQIADQLRGEGRLVSVDANARRLRILKENLARCGFVSVETVERDLTQVWLEEEGAADAVLVDVPCSGLGTLRRKVDLRYRLLPGDILELSEKSRAILETASALVKPGGRLVYSTCTLTSEENEEVVESFLKAHPDEWIRIAEGRSPIWLYSEEESAAGDDSDGSYRALLRKTSIGRVD